MENKPIEDIVQEKKAFRRRKYSKTLILWTVTVFLLSVFVLIAGSHLYYRYRFMIPVLVLSFLLLIVELRDEFSHKRLQTIILKTLEIRIALLLVCTAFVIIFIFLYFGAVCTEPCQNGFANARIEWFVWLCFILGLVGAYWAIIAKMRADDAFFASSEAFEQARRTLLSFGGSVDFDDIANEESERMLPALIRNARSELFVVAPIPLVGFFRKPNMGKTIIRVLTQKLQVLADTNCAGLKNLFLINFDRETNEGYLNQWKTEEENKINAIQGITENEKNNRKQEISNSMEEFKEALSAFENVVVNIKRKKGMGLITSEINTTTYSVDIGLRFVVSTDINDHDVITREQALVWVVSDFGLTAVVGFESAGFSTRDHVIISVLRRLAADYINNLPTLRRNN